MTQAARRYRRSIGAKSQAFTVVELLIVILVIGILAVLVVVAYNGITRHAVEVSMKSDLDNIAAQLEVDKRQDGEYPSSAGEVNNGGGLKASQDNVLSYDARPYGYCISASNPKTGATFYIKATNPTKIEDGSCAFSVNTTWVGSGTYGYADGSGSAVQFVDSSVYGIGPTAVDSQGNVYLANASGNRVRKITPGGVVSTFAGDGTNTTLDGIGTAAKLNNPGNIAIDINDNIFFGGVRKITPQQVVSTITASSVGTVRGVDQSGNIWTTSAGCVRKLSPTGTVLITSGVCGTYGYMDGSAANARFNATLTGALDDKGVFYVSDRENNRIRKVAQDGTVGTYFGSGASSGNSAPVDGTQATATLNEVRNIALDPTGAMWVTTKNNFMYLRKISPDGTTITTYGGVLNGTEVDKINLPEPGYMSVDSKRGFMYVTGGSSYIWRISL